MFISNIHIDNFRNIKKADVKFGPINIFTGRNSSGKSNLLLALSNSLRTDPDFSTEFFDNIVTYGKGMSKTVFKTTISGISSKRIHYRKDDKLYFAPEKFVFENAISKKTSASAYHKLYYTGDFSRIAEGSLSSFDKGFELEEEEFKKAVSFKHYENELVYERNFEERIETTENKELVKVSDEKNFKNQENLYALFSEFKDKIYSWVRPKSFSSSAIYEHVTETYESEIYDQVLRRLNSKEDNVSFVPFRKARFIFLVADIQRDERQKELLKRDLDLYTDGIVKDVIINTDGSQGTKGEIWVESPHNHNPKDITSISAGTAVLIYFIVLKNWVELSNKSFVSPEVMLFDEVDSIIHPSLMQNFNEVLTNISKKIQIFVTTHSPHFIDCFGKEQVYWLRDTTLDLGAKTASSIYSYEDILGKVKKNSEFLKKESNSKLFIEGLLDSIFPNIHE